MKIVFALLATLLLLASCSEQPTSSGNYPTTSPSTGASGNSSQSRTQTSGPSPTSSPNAYADYNLAVQWALGTAEHNNDGAEYPQYDGMCLAFVYDAYKHENPPVYLQNTVSPTSGDNTYPQDILQQVEGLGTQWVPAPKLDYLPPNYNIPEGAILFFLNTGGKFSATQHPGSNESYDRFDSHVVISTGAMASDDSVWTVSTGGDSASPFASFTPIADPKNVSLAQLQYVQGVPPTPNNTALDAVHTETAYQLIDNSWAVYEGYWMPAGGG